MLSVVLACSGTLLFHVPFNLGGLPNRIRATLFLGVKHSSIMIGGHMSYTLSSLKGVI